MPYSAHTDIELLNDLHQSKEGAFTEIFNRYWNKLFFVAHKHIKAASAAEEIVQEVFMALWQKRASLAIESLPLYLAAMTRYAVYHHLAKQKRRRDLELGFLKAEPTTNRELEYFDNRFLLEIIEKLSNELPEKCRLVFIQNKLLDIPLSQVAESLDISVKTAEAHLTKALKSMRANLGDAMSIFLL